MMSERQAEFRREYRSRIVGRYNGYFHIAVIYALGLAAMVFYIQHIQDVRVWEWLAIPVFFLGCNIFEWAVHRFVMHRPIDIPGLKQVYQRHTLNHHQFFTDAEVRFRDHQD